ncbi:MAG TPA: hypothetical protein VIQ76_10415, partial [Propionibacteriaceae bacterium]
MHARPGSLHIADQLCRRPSGRHRVKVEAAAAAQFGYSKRLARQEIGQLRNRSESAWQVGRGQLSEPRLLACKGGAIGIGETGAVVPPGISEPL